MATNAPTNQELAQQIADLTAVVTNLAQAMTANQAAVAAAPTVAAPVVAPAAAAATFAISPGSANVEQPIDYTSKRGSALYEQVIKSLDTAFNMKEEQVLIFQKELAD